MADKTLDENLEDAILTQEGDGLTEDDGTVQIFVSDDGQGDDSINPVAALLSIVDSGEGDDSISPNAMLVPIMDSSYGVDVITRRTGSGIYKTLNITFTPKLGKIIYQA